MTYTPEFYSVKETEKPIDQRVHHNNSACISGLNILHEDRRFGTNNYRLCDICTDLNEKGK